MLAPNHLLGGVVFTGTFAALFGENVLSTPIALGVCVAGSLMPDVDNPRAPAGIVLLPLSRWLYRNYGHRTVTHSLVALLSSTLVMAALNCYPLIWFFAYLSHLIFDMMTLQGVPFFYPFLKNPAVIPGDPSLRFRTGDLKAESITFAIFIALGTILRPLFEQGFWTTYNKSFGTQKHLAEEYQRSKDLLAVKYSYDIGSQNFVGSGYAVEATETKTVLIDDNHTWKLLNANDVKMKSITFEHTNRPFFIDNQTFIQIDVDSLNRLLANKNIVEIELQTNGTGRITQNGIDKEFKTFKANYPNQLFFSSRDSSFKAEPFFDLPSVSAKIKRHQIQMLKDEYEMKMKKFNAIQDEIKQILADTTKNYMVVDRQVKRLKELRAEKMPELDVIQMKQLEYEALLAEQQDQQQRQIRLTEHQYRMEEKRKNFHKTLFSGFLKILKY